MTFSHHKRSSVSFTFRMILIRISINRVLRKMSTKITDRSEIIKQIQISGPLAREIT